MPPTTLSFHKTFLACALAEADANALAGRIHPALLAQGEQTSADGTRMGDMMLPAIPAKR